METEWESTLMLWWQLYRLRSWSSGSRERAAKALAKRRDARAVDALSLALKDEHWWVRSAAAEALGKIGDLRAVEPLGEALKREDTFKRENSTAYHDLVKALGEIGHSSCVEPLISALSRWYPPQPYVSHTIINALGTIGGMQAAEGLARMLRDNKDQKLWAEIRIAAATALGKIGAVQAIKSLVQALEDEIPSVRHVAAEALAVLGWQPANAKQRVLRAIAAREYEAAAVEGGTALEPLLFMLKFLVSSHHANFKGISWQDHLHLRRILDALKEIDAIAVAIELLVTMLKEEARSVLPRPGRAVQALCEIDDTRVVEALISVLKSNDTSTYETKQTIIAALARIRDVRALEPLVGALQDRNPRIREMAISALEAIGGSQVVSLLEAALQDEDGGVQEAAAWVLARMDSSLGIQWLVAKRWELVSRATVGYSACPDERAERDMLVHLLQKIGSHFPAGDLYTLSHRYDGIYEYNYDGLTYRETVDFSSVRELAQHELARRGQQT